MSASLNSSQVVSFATTSQLRQHVHYRQTTIYPTLPNFPDFSDQCPALWIRDMYRLPLGTHQQVDKLPTGDVHLPASVHSQLFVIWLKLCTVSGRWLTTSRRSVAMFSIPAVPITNLRQITQSLTPIVAQTLDQAFVSCQLAYCNSLLNGISDSSVYRLLASLYKKAVLSQR